MDNSICGISIIVPVYKAENYLDRCIESLLKQSFNDYEIILVDDGSPDSSGEICDRYAQEHNNIYVIHTENRGVGAARQCGLDNARGKYVIHADPDDWVEKDMLTTLYRTAEECNADMVICDYYVNDFTTGSNLLIKQSPYSLKADEVLKEMLHRLHGSCWNKLVRRKCFADFNITFPTEFSLNEDLYINLSLLKNDISIAYVPEAFYHYSVGLNNNSIVKSSNYSIQTFKEDLNKRRQFLEMMVNHKYYNEVNMCITFGLVARAYNSGFFSSHDFRINMYPFRNEVLENKYYSCLTRIKLYLSCIGLYGPLYKMSHLKNRYGSK